MLLLLSATVRSLLMKLTSFGNIFKHLFFWNDIIYYTLLFCFWRILAVSLKDYNLGRIQKLKYICGELIIMFRIMIITFFSFASFILIEANSKKQVHLFEILLRIWTDHYKVDNALKNLALRNRANVAILSIQGSIRLTNNVE